MELAQDGPAAQVFRRHDAGWLSFEVLGRDAVLRLESLRVEVGMADFYAGLPIAHDVSSPAPG